MDSIAESNPPTHRLVGSKPSSPRLHQTRDGPEIHHPAENGRHLHERPDTSPPEVYEFEVPVATESPGALRKAHSEKKRALRASPVTVKTAFPELPRNGESSGRGPGDGESGLTHSKLVGEWGSNSEAPTVAQSKPGLEKDVLVRSSAREESSLKGSPRLSPSGLEIEDSSMLFRPRKVPTARPT